jgi:predicted TIM-barrel enzyme
MIRTARKMGIFTMAYTYNIEDAQDMAGIPVDVLCAHGGGTRGGFVGFKTDPLEVSLKTIQGIMEAAREVNPNIICLAHGGAVAEPEDTKPLYEKTIAQGFVGASSMERIPIERAVTDFIQRFKNIPMKKNL